jgi:GntR family transcriptional regulator/MocR family aminotransferase
MGTASKILAHGLRLGWVLLPETMIGAVVQEKVRDDPGSNAPPQLTLARFIECVHVDRHVRRARRTYRTRREALVDALAAHLPDARIQGIAAGLHALVLLPDRVDEEKLRERAKARGVAICGLRAFRARPKPQPLGLVLGYGNLPAAKITRGIQKVALAAARA